MPFLNQQKEKQKYVAGPGIKPGTSGSIHCDPSLEPSQRDGSNMNGSNEGQNV